MAEGTNTADDSYFGACPVCHHTDGHINVGRDHWGLCVAHRMKWFIGSNLFSSWREESGEEQRKICDDLNFGEFEQVEPWYSEEEQSGGTKA